MIKIKYQSSSEVKSYTSIETFTIGADPRNDCILLGKNLPAKIFIITKRENFLTLKVLNDDFKSTLNQIVLEKEKNYLLEINDHLQIEGHHFYLIL